MCAIREGMIDQYIDKAIEVFLHFNKPVEGFRFLESVEQRIPEESEPTFQQAVRRLVDFSVRQKGDQIEKTLLSNSFSAKQTDIINAHVR